MNRLRQVNFLNELKIMRIIIYSIFIIVRNYCVIVAGKPVT